MPLLPCKGYVKPILSILSKHASGLSGSDLTEQVAANTNLTEEERKEAITDGTPKYVVRIKQARYWLKNQQFVEAIEGGIWAITNLGNQFLEQTGGTPVKLSRASGKKTNNSSPRQPINDEEIEEAPLEKIDQALNQINQELTIDLLQRLTAATPLFFERSVLELMRAMGYAGDRGGVKHTGGAGDGGIDGILYFDRLGLERVYVQAKRDT